MFAKLVNVAQALGIVAEILSLRGTKQSLIRLLCAAQ
jgi:hypothetical protein